MPAVATEAGSARVGRAPVKSAMAQPGPAEFERMLENAKRHGQVFLGDR